MKANLYETERYLHEYLLFHYGRPRDLCPFDFVPDELLHFHERILKECVLPFSHASHTRALDVGCAVGRFTFELSRLADEVIGVDNSKRFVLTARKIASQRAIKAHVHESGAEITTCRLQLPKGVRPAKIQFEVRDAQKLGPIDQEPFDIVAAINLICRLPRPLDFLRQLPRLVVLGGQLLIASPLSWLRDYTPPRNWITPEDLQRVLRPHFQLIRRRDLPFVIREHRRKYQLVVSEVLTFKRC